MKITIVTFLKLFKMQRIETSKFKIYFMSLKFQILYNLINVFLKNNN